MSRPIVRLILVVAGGAILALGVYKLLSMLGY
jgi:hypothetical protein